MVGTICPVGDGTRSTRARAFDAASFLLGCVGGAAALGLLLAGTGEILLAPVAGGALSIVFVATVALIALAVDLGLVTLRFSPFPRQVDAALFSVYLRPVLAARWGIEQGFGLLTHVNWAGFYVALALALVTGLPYGVLVLAAFGLVRGAQPVFMLALTEARHKTDEFFNDFSRAYPDFGILRTASLVSALALPFVVWLWGAA